MTANDGQLGRGVKIFHSENLYSCETKIVGFGEIQKNVAVEGRCKISSHNFLCESVDIEDEVFIGHKVMLLTTSICIDE
jgi:carbonic anhydrase/acetyltransferase-like protein (isoleucine patch superfamily)